jgi:hypothetical protein
MIFLVVSLALAGDFACYVGAEASGADWNGSGGRD